MTRKSTLRTGIVAGLMTLAMLLSAAPVFAAGGPPAGRGGGGGKGGGQGGGGGETTVPNNLSVPAIFILSDSTTDVPPSLNLTCSPTATDPTGIPLTNYPIASDAYYYVQGIHTWQASCFTGTGYTSASAYASWGDNLAGDAALKTGSPIRVEMGLLQGSFNADPAVNKVVPTVVGTGYTVDKLDPNALDRDAAYGTLAKQTDGVWGPAARNDAFPETRVWVADATLTLTNNSTGAVTNLDPTAEINSTGRVVYGYNLRVNTAGSYTLKFTVPSSITITGRNRGDVTVNADGTTTISLSITVTGGGGGGGGRP